MLLLHRTYPDPSWNLALDEVLLLQAEKQRNFEVVRFWQPDQPCVVLGYTNHIRQEVNLERCATLKIPVQRRISGGGTVVQGPGCLCYSLVLQSALHGELKGVGETNCWVMHRLRQAVDAVIPGSCQVQGISDLTLGERKFCGNAQRRKPHAILFHGSFLLDADLSLVEQVLRSPERQPDYRAHRSHLDFLINLRVEAWSLAASIAHDWNAEQALPTVDDTAVHYLAETQYQQASWVYRS